MTRTKGPGQKDQDKRTRTKGPRPGPGPNDQDQNYSNPKSPQAEHFRPWSCCYPVPWQPGVGDVVVILRVPHQEHVVPLGDDLTVGSQCLSSFILNRNILLIGYGWLGYHVHYMIESHLQGYIHHIMGVSCGEDIVTIRVVPQQVHRQLGNIEFVRQDILEGEIYCKLFLCVSVCIYDVYFVILI